MSVLFKTLLVLTLVDLAFVKGNFLLHVRFINYTNPSGLCAECNTIIGNGAGQVFNALDVMPVCCDEGNKTDNCTLTGSLSCDTRFRWNLRPFGRSLETRPSFTTNPGFPAYYFTDCSLPESQCPFSDVSRSFEGPTGFLGVDQNPLIVDTARTETFTNWPGRVQFFIEAIHSAIPNVIDSILVDLDDLELGYPEFTNEETYIGFHNISYLRMSFRVECAPQFINNTNCNTCSNTLYDVTTGCSLCIVRQLDHTNNCETCIEVGFDPQTNCTTCSPNRDILTNCAQCLHNGNESTDCTTCDRGWDIATGCTACLPGRDLNNSCESCLAGYINQDQDICIMVASSTTENTSGPSESVNVPVIGGLVAVIVILSILLLTTTAILIFKFKRSSTEAIAAQDGIKEAIVMSPNPLYEAKKDARDITMETNVVYGMGADQTPGNARERPGGETREYEDIELQEGNLEYDYVNNTV